MGIWSGVDNFNNKNKEKEKSTDLVIKTGGGDDGTETLKPHKNVDERERKKQRP